MLLYSHVTLVIPGKFFIGCLNHFLFLIESPATLFTYIMTLVHMILWSVSSIVFLLSSCTDPGYLKNEFDLGKMLENFHPDDICPRCEVLTTPRSHHCVVCDRCVERWDHHCPWINNCVGVRNHNYFIVLLFSTCLLLGLYIEPPITSFFLEKSDLEPTDFYA